MLVQYQESMTSTGNTVKKKNGHGEDNAPSFYFESKVLSQFQYIVGPPVGLDL